MDHRRWGLGIKVFIVSLSTPSAELTRDLAPSLSVMRRTNGGRYAPILLTRDVRRRIDELDAMAKKAKWHLLVPLLHTEIVEEAQEKPFCRAMDITGLT